MPSNLRTQNEETYTITIDDYRPKIVELECLRAIHGELLRLSFGWRRG